MNDPLVQGDHASCSRLGGAMRRHAARLGDRAQALHRLEDDLRGWQGPAGDVARHQLAVELRVLESAAQDLDLAGAMVQRYATELVEAHELGRRAELGVAEAGLELQDGRVVEPWGVSDSAEALRRRDAMPQAQARVDRATAQIGRVRGSFQRAAVELTQSFAAHSRALRAIPASAR